MDDKEMSLIDRLREEQLDLLIKYALLQAEQDKEVETEIEQNGPDMELFERALRKYQAEREQEAKEARRQKLISALRGTARAVACLIIIIAIAAPIAFASIPPFRQYVAGMMVSALNEREDTHTAEDKNSIVPQGWTGEYYTYFIPKRYKFAGTGEYEAVAVYKDAAWDTLYFIESDDYEQLNVDLENAEIIMEPINKSTAMILRKGDTLQMVWTNDECYFMIIGRLTIEEIDFIAKNVRKVSA